MPRPSRPRPGPARPSSRGPVAEPRPDVVEAAAAAQDEAWASGGGGRARTCIGCGQRVLLDEPGAAELVRLILLTAPPAADGARYPATVIVDAGDGGFGRGAHVHAVASCVAGAARRGLARATRSGDVWVEGLDGERAQLSAASLGAAIAAAYDRRLAGLLVSARRARALELGSDATSAACARGDADLVVVATDAAAAASLAQVQRAVSEGRAVAWSTKDALGELLAGGSPIAVVAVTDDRVSRAIEAAHRAAMAGRAAQRDESKRARSGARGSAAAGGPGLAEA